VLHGGGFWLARGVARPDCVVNFTENDFYQTINIQKYVQIERVRLFHSAKVDSIRPIAYLGAK
jgi:hypothetical protein